MTNFKLKIASRRSKLAMVQTLWVKDQLEKNIPNLEVSIEAMATQGDKILDAGSGFGNMSKTAAKPVRTEVP